MKTTHLLSLALASLTLAGCKCGPVHTNSLVPELVANPTALAIDACPTKDGSGATVPDVYPSSQKVSVQNRGLAIANLTLSLTGGGSADFSIAKNAPTEIAVGDTVDIEVLFSPTHSGASTANLVIDDGADSTPNLKVPLNGLGSDLPSQAQIETGPQKLDKSGFLTCTSGSLLADCTLEFPNTLFGQTETREIKIRNTGCPALKLTELSIQSAYGDTQGFTIESPATLPNAGTPLVLSQADGTQEITVVIRWSPVDDGTLNYYRDAQLVIKSNDQVYGSGTYPPAVVALTGQGIKPSMYSTPTLCNFSNPNDLCGNSTKVTNSATFRVTNDGNAAIHLDEARFSNGSTSASADGRFTVATTIEGQTLQPTQSVTLVIEHHDLAPLYVGEQLTLKASAGGAVGTAGILPLQLFGGLKPCLTTDPADTLNFLNPATELSAQHLKIKNGAGCGSLIVNQVAIDPNPYFTLLNQVAPGTQVAAGTELSVDVQYQRPASGGIQLSTLRLKSNDSDFTPEKLVQLVSDSPLDQMPVAVATACAPADLVGDPTCANGTSGTLVVQYSAITPKVITISGAKSYDPDPASPGGTKPVVQWRFKLLAPFPSGVTTAALANYDQVITSPTTTLTLPSGSTGYFRLQVVVYDDRGQLSSNVGLVSVNVYP